MTTPLRLPRPAISAALAAALLALGAAGCSHSGPDSRELYRERESSFKLLDQGTSEDDAGKPLLALERFNRAALVHESPKAWYLLGQQFEQADKPDQAATAYNRALELAPDYQEARLSLLSLGFTPPGYTPTKEDLALAADLAAKRQTARDARLAAASARDTAASEAQQAAAEARRKEILDQAAERRLPTQTEVQTVIFAPDVSSSLPSALSPTYTANEDIILGTYAYHLRKAEQLRGRSQYTAAEQEFQRAIELDPTKIDARLELGDMLFQDEEHPEQALYQYNRAIQDFPASPRPYHHIGNFYFDQTRYEEARTWYRRALDKDPGYMKSYINLAAIDYLQKNYDSATKLLDEVIRQDPTQAMAYFNRGIIASDINHDRQKALDCFNRYIELEPNGANAAKVRGWIRDLRAQPD